jgi:hypothetical protein
MISLINAFQLNNSEMKRSKVKYLSLPIRVCPSEQYRDEKEQSKIPLCALGRLRSPLQTAAPPDAATIRPPPPTCRPALLLLATRPQGRLAASRLAWNSRAIQVQPTTRRWCTAPRRGPAPGRSPQNHRLRALKHSGATCVTVWLCWVPCWASSLWLSMWRTPIDWEMTFF